ncbi:MAG: DNA-directed RNA polymerase subunit alpha [Chloroflexi bacterium]|nr:DNA-directed RNA polymerase subunit alpha [Chloroflexota bacterium]
MIDIMLPKVEQITSSGNYGKYQIEPLDPGFGVTLGNALRRVLLSSLPGAAITAMKIDNVYHEFSAIPHVKEDTTEIILNVKQIRLRSFSDRPVQCFLEARGAGRVTAADINCPPDVEIINLEQPVATIDSEEGHLTVEFTVEKGKGYLPAEHREGLPIGVIPVDAIFTPVRRVNYTVEPTRVGQVTNYDRLLIEVWSDGTITPDEAVSQTSQLLVRHLNLLIDLVAQPVARGEKQQLTGYTIPSKFYDMPIEDLDLSVRAYNCLKRAGITRVGQVLEMSEDDLLGVRNFGRKSLDELRERLQARGLLDHARIGVAEPEVRPAVFPEGGEEFRREGEFEYDEDQEEEEEDYDEDEDEDEDE